MTPIHTIKSELDIIIEKISDDTSSVVSFTALASKTLILGCASYLESRVTEVVVQELRISGKESCPVYNFAKNQGVSRKYHTWFDWKKTNAVDFYAQFGHDFKVFAAEFMDEEERRNAEFAFMKIGSDRNILIHNNYLSYSINDGYAEIFARCERAMRYPLFLSELFVEFKRGYQ